MAEPKQPQASQIFAQQPSSGRLAFPHQSWDPFTLAQRAFDYLARAGQVPQQPTEDNAVYGVRRSVGSPFAALQSLEQNAGSNVQQAINYAATSPAEAEARKPKEPAGQKYDPGFETAWNFTLQHEGGYNPSDANGAPVNFGINQGANPDVNVKDLTPEKAKQLAYDRYWKPSGAAKLPPELQTMHFDTYYINPKAAQRILTESGGDPQRYIQLRDAWFKSIGGRDTYGKAWDTRTSDLARQMLGQNLISPFSPQYMNQSLSEIEKGRQAALTPTNIPFQGAPMPEPPMPEAVPKTDFSQADARLEALRPVEMSIKEQEGLKWKNFWSGMGQAMMSSPNGEGLGSLFLRMGGAALGAKGQTYSDIQAYKDAYDAKMAKWQAALYENDFQKAQISQRELMADWQNKQSWALEKYKAGMEVWSKTTMPTVAGNNLIFQSIDPATGKGSVVIQPIASLVNADAAKDRANVYSQAFGIENSANAQVAGVANRVQGQIALATAGQVLADQSASPQEKAAAAAFGPISAVKYAIDTGQVAAVVGENETEALTKEITKTLTAQGMFPGQKGYDEAFKEAATGRLLAFAMQSPVTLDKLMSTMGPASNIYNAYERYQNRTERTTTNNRGQTQSQVTYEGE